MEKKIAIITDTGADNLSELTPLGVDFIPLYITFDGNNYIKQIVDVSIEEFYSRLESSSFYPKTSLPSVMDYVDIFNKHLDNNEDIIYIAINSKFSGAYQASLAAREMILEENKDAKIEIIDSLAVTFAQFAMAREAAIMANNNESFDAIVEKVKKMIPTDKVFMTLDSLENLKVSGRVSNFSAAIGGLLNIKPLLKFEDGLLFPTSKVKGMNKALRQVIKEAKEYVENDIDSYKISIIHGNHLDNAIEFRKDVAEELNIPEDKLEFCNMGVCIGLHAGPTLMGIGCIKYKNFD